MLVAVAKGEKTTRGLACSTAGTSSSGDRAGSSRLWERSMADVKLEARVREGRGGKDAKALRAAGEIPAVIYTSTSGKDGATPICVGARDLRTAVSGSGGRHAIIDLTIDGKRK